MSKPLSVTIWVPRDLSVDRFPIVSDLTDFNRQFHAKLFRSWSSQTMAMVAMGNGYYEVTAKGVPMAHILHGEIKYDDGSTGSVIMPHDKLQSGTMEYILHRKR